MFHLDVSKVDLMLHMLQWLYSHVSSVSYVFKRMLQIFYLYVSKVDLVLQAVVRRYCWCAIMVHCVGA
jgi:hypothetical protein